MCFRGIYDGEKDEVKTRLTPAEWAEAEANGRQANIHSQSWRKSTAFVVNTLQTFQKARIRERRGLCWEMVRESLKSDAELRAKARAER